MLFNSVDFALFLPLMLVLYWSIPKKHLKWQNSLIAAGSYFFYGWWDWRFLALILLSSVVDFSLALALDRQENAFRRKLLLWTSIGVNLGVLGFFKYFNFFLDNFLSAYSLLGADIQANSLNIILPVGISFYTFQTLSYTIDVYKRKLKPTSDFISFTAFVSFFPQLVAGPIERATHLLPQFARSRTFEYHKAVDGLRQILWGLFKKVMVADNCAEFANHIFNNSGDYSGSTLVLGALFFTFQIYGDFSGYSDIAIGTARLFGFDLKRNFAFPYFSRDIAEFWRRWHISLSTWFRDYLYIPLGGSRGGRGMQIRNTMIIFIVSGFWHGANWTFIIWGALNALYFLPLLLRKKNRTNMEIVAPGRFFPSFRDATKILSTFGLTVLAWVFFRAENVSHAFSYLAEIFSPSLFSIPSIVGGIAQSLPTLALVLVMLLAEWLQRDQEHVLAWNNWRFYKPAKWALKLAMVELILLESLASTSQEFIYFDF